MAFMALVIIASAPLLGGKLSRFAGVRLEHPLVLAGALVLQVLITEVIAAAPRGLLVALHLASYAMAAWVVWCNRRVPGLVLIGAGALSNAVVIALNGGTLPASARALRASGMVENPKDFENSGVLAHPILPWLGDIAATPSWLPFRNVISVGDIAILFGAAIMVHVVSRSLPARRVLRLGSSSDVRAATIG